MVAFFAFCLAFASGCAHFHAENCVAPEGFFEESTPVLCEGEKDCKAKWKDAKGWVLKNTTLKLKKVSDEVIETDTPEPGSPTLAFCITKDQIGTTAHVIIAKVWCDNVSGCEPTKADMLMDFDDYMNSYGSRYANGF